MILTEYLRELPFLFFEIVSFYIFTCAVFGHKLKTKIKPFSIIVISVFVVSYLVTLEADNVFSFLIMFSFYFISILFVFRERFFNSFLVFVSEYIVITFSQILLVPFFNFFSIAMNSYSAQIIGNIYTIILIFIIYKKIPLHFYIRFLNQTSILPKTIVANSFILTVGFVYYSKISSDRFLHYFILLFVILLLILFINGDLIITNNKMTNQKKQLEAYQEYLPIIEQLIDHVRQTQHAHNNNIQAIRMLPTSCDTYEELSTELLHYTDYLVVENEPVSLLKINLKLLSGLLYSKILYAQSQNKRLRIDIMHYIFRQNIPEYDLITMIGILVDNALEASKENDSIYASLKSENKKLVFCIKNIGPLITPEFISSIFQKGYTTKRNDSKNHGIGLFHLKSMTDSYKGSITVFNEKMNEQNYLCFELKV